MQLPSSLDDPTCNQATSGWVTGIHFRRLATFDKPEARSSLGAKQHVMRCEKQWWAASQSDQHEQKLEIYDDTSRHYEFLDCDALPF